MPYPKEVYLMTEADFICEAGGRKDTKECQLKSKACLIEWANVIFGSHQEYENRVYELDTTWDSVPKRVYNTLLKTALEVYPEYLENSLLYNTSHMDSLEWEIDNALEDVDLLKDDLNKVRKDVIDRRNYQKSEAKKDLLEKMKKYPVQYVIEMNDEGDPESNALVWNTTMKKLGYG